MRDMPRQADRSRNMRKLELALATRNERVTLLKQGYNGKCIESRFLKLNGFTVTKIEWWN